MSSVKLSNSLRTFLKPTHLTGKLGYVVGGVASVQTDDPSLYNVRLDDGRFILAYHNNRVAPSYDAVVSLISEVQDGQVIYKIIGAGTVGGGGANNPGMPAHSHSRASGMYFEVDTWLLNGFRVTVLSGTMLRISSGWYWYQGERQYFLGASIETAGEIPGTANEHCWTAITFDPSDETFTLTSSTPQSIALPLLEANIPAAPAGEYPVAAVKLLNGMTTIVDSYIVDQRFALTGSGVQSVQDDGTDMPQRSKINLIAGTNVTITVADSSANNRTDVTIAASGGGSSITGDVLPATCEGRLTLESGVPISTTDQTAKTTLYFTPHHGSIIALYDGSSTWTGYTLSEISASLSGLTADTNYDVFVYDNSGTLTLDLVAWTDGTTRATALTMQNGVYVKSGATARRYVGTIRITGTTGQCEDSVLKRRVWNAQNRVARMVKVRDTTASWPYQSGTIRQVRGQSANQFDVVVGLREEVLSITALLSNYHLSNATSGQTFIGENSTATPHADCIAGYAGYGFATWTAHLDVIPPLGYTYYAWLEVTNAGVSMTMYGASQGSGVDGVFYA